jgi:polyisoprenoid-binding protein YceI
MKNGMTARLVGGFIIVAILLSHGQSSSDPARAIDTARSVLTVRVYKTGLFSAFAHDHEIRAPIQKGAADEEKNTVEFTVDARALRVLDPGVSEKDRADIQSTMLGPKVLDSEKFPEIRFRSTSIGEGGDDKWIVRGDLTLHGQTHPLKVDVTGSDGHYAGSVRLSQKDFGITPVSIAGGSVKVKDEILVEFEIFAK